MIAIKTKVTPAKYFAKMIFKSEIGLVKSNSIVPVLLSSAIERIVIAGIRIKKIIGHPRGQGSAFDPLF